MLVVLVAVALGIAELGVVLVVLGVLVALVVSGGVDGGELVVDREQAAKSVSETNAANVVRGARMG